MGKSFGETQFSQHPKLLVNTQSEGMGIRHSQGMAIPCRQCGTSLALSVPSCLPQPVQAAEKETGLGALFSLLL